MKSPGSAPMRKRKLADVVYGAILEQIVSGKIIEGDKLPSESELCAKFNVSRSVTREALMRLQVDGLTKTHTGIGTFVMGRPLHLLKPVSGSSRVSEYLLCLEPRIVLEVEAARLAALRRTKTQLAAIQAANDGLREEIGRGHLGREQDIKFHNCIASAAGNENFLVLLKTIGDLTTQTITAGLELGRGQIRTRVVEEHSSIVDAIAIEDSEGAATYMRYHLFQARSALIGEHHLGDMPTDYPASSRT